jgi:hypothetical protein
MKTRSKGNIIVTVATGFGRLTTLFARLFFIVFGVGLLWFWVDEKINGPRQPTGRYWRWDRTCPGHRLTEEWIAKHPGSRDSVMQSLGVGFDYTLEKRHAAVDNYTPLPEGFKRE